MLKYIKSKLHIHRYHIVGTGSLLTIYPFINENFTEVNLVCNCGKCGNVYTRKTYDNELFRLAANHKYFHMDRNIVFTENEINNLINEIKNL